MFQAKARCANARQPEGILAFWLCWVLDGPRPVEQVPGQGPQGTPQGRGTPPAEAGLPDGQPAVGGGSRLADPGAPAARAQDKAV